MNKALKVKMPILIANVNNEAIVGNEGLACYSV